MASVKGHGYSVGYPVCPYYPKKNKTKNKKFFVYDLKITIA
jgi:hypothetical protein